MHIRPRTWFPVTIPLLALCLTGCVTTQLGVTSVATKTDGEVYYLPRAEFSVEVDRELVRCVVRPKLRDSMELWILKQVDGLNKIRTALDELTLLKRSLYCDTDRENVEKKLSKDLAQRLRKQPFERGTCGSKTPENFETEVDRALDFLVDAFLEDPYFEINGAARTLEGHGFVASKEARTNLDRLVAAARGITKPDPIATEVMLDVDIEAEIDTHFLADMSHAYTIDYAGTRKSLKATDYEVKHYENGTLKSINAGLDDQTGAFIQSTLTGVLRLAAGVGGFGLDLAAVAAADPAVAPDPSGPQADATQVELLTFERHEKRLLNETPQLCTEPVRDLLAERATLVKTLGELPAKIRRLKAAHDAASTALTEAEKTLEKAKEDGKKGDELKPFEKAVNEKTAAKKAAKSALDSAEKLAEPASTRLGLVRSALTVSSVAHLRPQNAPVQQSVGGERKGLVWFDSQRLQDVCRATGGLTCDVNNVPEELLAWTAIYLSPSTPATPKPPASQGVVYRQPARGLILVCTHAACLDAQGGIQAISDHLVLTDAVDVPQLGVLARLPLVNKSFQNNRLQADFAASGTLTRVAYTSNARAVAQAKTFSESADSLLTFFEARRNSEAEKLQAEIDKLGKQLELEQAKKALEDFKNGVPATDPADDAGDNDDGGDNDDDGDNGGGE